MNKLLAALIAGTFALGPMAAMADDKTPSKTTPEEQAKMKADREAAKAAKAQMTPEEKNAAKKAKRKQKVQEETQIEKVGQPTGPGKAETMKKSVDATKGDPKPLPDAKAKQEALKETTKKAGPGQ